MQVAINRSLSVIAFTGNIGRIFLFDDDLADDDLFV